MKSLLEELEFCLDLWKKQGKCLFGGGTKCEECASPYLLYKMLTKKHLDSPKRLDLKEWEALYRELQTKENR
jgi:hypothetical protein